MAPVLNQRLTEGLQKYEQDRLEDLLSIIILRNKAQLIRLRVGQAQYVSSSSSSLVPDKNGFPFLSRFLVYCVLYGYMYPTLYSKGNNTHCILS